MKRIVPNSGFSLIEFVVASTVSSILIGGLIVLTTRLEKGRSNETARTETDLDLALLAGEIIQRGATAAVDCNETAGALVCRSERANGAAYEFRYLINGGVLEAQERIPPAAWTRVKVYPNISNFTVCQASKVVPACALENAFLHAAGAGNQRARFFRFLIQSSLSKGTKTAGAKAGTEYRASIQSAFYVRSPFLTSDPSIKLVGGKKL